MILFGCFLVALAIKVFNTTSLLIGGTAGLGILFQQITDVSFGTLFFLINIPFYILSIMQIGISFTIKSFLSISMLSIMSELLTNYVTFEIPYPIVSAVIGGILLGFGLILLFRSGSSLGGVNIVAVFLDKRFGINPGKTVFVTDALIVSSALFVFNIEQVLYSILAIIVMSVLLGRYNKTSPIEQNSIHVEGLEEKGIYESPSLL
jgi:uncharacterized membrane-anchored protein YitT (DUF2179 family)